MLKPRVSTRIFLAGGLLILTLAVISAIAIATFGRYHEKSGEIRDFTALATMGERLNREISAVVAETRGMYSSRNQDEIAQFIQPFETEKQELAEDLGRSRDLVPLSQRGEFARIEATAQKFLQIRTAIMEAARSEGPATARRLATSDEARANLAALQQDVTGLVKTSTATAAETDRQLDVFYHDRRLLLVSVASVGGLLATLIALAVVVFGVTRPLTAITAAVHAVAGGSLELAVPYRARRDEIGDLAGALEAFRLQARDKLELEQAQQQERRQAAIEKQAALRGMAERIEAETGAALDQVGQHTATMATTADGMSESATRTGTSAQSAAAAASLALANAQTVSSAAEQLAASIHEIAEQMGQSNTVVRRAVEASQHTRDTIEVLNGQVTRIGVVADMIAEIAAKTNLLALNATIEAARAGEAGKGFAVVAGEVKQLATQTARSTEEIARHINEVRSATSASVQAVGLIEQAVGEINTISATIAAAVDQQGAATAEIARNVTETASAANEMNERIAEVSAEAERTDQHAAEVRETTSALGHRVEELRHALIRVVRTSTTEVDRRQATRHAVDSPCEVIVPGKPPHAARLSDLSELGACIAQAPSLAAGSQATLRLTGFAAPVPFVVRAVEGTTLHVTFAAGAASAESIQAVLQRLGQSRAA